MGKKIMHLAFLIDAQFDTEGEGLIFTWNRPRQRSSLAKKAVDD